MILLCALRKLSLALLLMESQKSFTLPHIAFIVNELLHGFVPLNTSDAASSVVAEVSITARFRSALFAVFFVTTRRPSLPLVCTLVTVTR